MLWYEYLYGKGEDSKNGENGNCCPGSTSGLAALSHIFTTHLLLGMTRSRFWNLWQQPRAWKTNTNKDPSNCERIGRSLHLQTSMTWGCRHTFNRVHMIRDTFKRLHSDIKPFRRSCLEKTYCKPGGITALHHPRKAMYAYVNSTQQVW